MLMSLKSKTSLIVSMALLGFAMPCLSQQVTMPAPRLLTTMPMGGQAGSTFDVTITGENLDESGDLLFSTPKISAKPKLNAEGKAEPNKYTVTIAADAPRGVHEARVMSRLGVSSCRAFSVGSLAEVTREKPNTTPETALELKPNSICNAVATKRAVDFYTFQGAQGKRVVVDCATAGIDSKLTAVLIIADAQGRDLLADRAGGFLDFTPPSDGKYFIKVHGLTFQGGPEHFYRLALIDAPEKGEVKGQPSTLAVSAFSWTPNEKSIIPKSVETEPNNAAAQAQQITPPCEIAGAFYPAADVDTFEFAAKKGEVWWIEVVSERLGLPTDPFVLVQRVVTEGGKEKLADVAELNDIPSPMKPSSNGYSYDGPPYDAGSPDVLGKVEIKEDGKYRLQLRDLFGGTRSDARNVYRLIVRKAEPDFALVAWGFHMNLRNGDRNALSKPIALRGGSTMALEVVAVRKDGFDGEIQLGMDNLPAGVTAAGLKIPAGKQQGMMLITAAENAPRSIAGAKLFGTADVNGAKVKRPCRVASMSWPVRDASQEIPHPRLMEDAPVSVNGSENAPVSIAPKENKVFEAKAGEKLTIPLKIAWRSEFTGTSIKLRAFGAGFEGVKEFDLPLKAANSDAVLDLAALKTVPGEYTLAFYGSAVTKYRYNPDAIKTAAEEEKKAEQKAATMAANAKKLAEEAKAAAAAKKAEAEAAAKLAAEQLKSADAAKAGAAKRMKAVTDAATPTDTVDIFVSEPIRILVTAADKK